MEGGYENYSVSERIYKKDGSFLFDAETGFFCDYENVGNSISSFLKTCGIGWRTGDDIKFTSDGSDSSSEAYTLVVGEDGVKVSAKSERGLFYGAQTLKQLILSSFDEKTKTAEIPCCEINDEPRFFVPRIYVRHRPTLFPGRSREKVYRGNFAP